MVVVAGIAFWLLQKARNVRVTSRAPKVSLPKTSEISSFSSSLFYTSAILLEKTPFRSPSHNPGRLWLACWAIFSLITLTMYRSSLVASLSVPQLSVTVDTIQQLLNQRGWTWGIEPGHGIGWAWLKGSESPDVQKVFASLEILDTAEQMERLSEGEHAFFTWLNYARALIASEYTDRNGYTPLHISRERFLNTGCIWGCRKGAPFLRKIVDMKQRLLEGDFLRLWLDEIFADFAKRARGDKATASYIKHEGDQVVLGMYHLQGAFYLLFIGYGLAFALFLKEFLQCNRSDTKENV